MSGKYWIGLLFIVFGFGFLLHQADIWDFLNVLSTWWPLIVIGIGVIHIVNSTYTYLPVFMFIFIGGFILVDRAVDMDLIPYLWPLILITIGLTFMFSKVHHTTHKDSNQIIHTFSLFSGVDAASQSQKFKGGSVTAVFGGAEIDLRETALSEEGAALDLTALFGGISIFVPDHVQVEITGLPIFGGWDNKINKPKHDEAATPPILKVNCLTAFGGVEIKN